MADGWTLAGLNANSLEDVYTFLRDQAGAIIRQIHQDGASQEPGVLPALLHAQMLDGELSPQLAPSSSLSEVDVKDIEKLGGVAAQALLDPPRKTGLADHYLLQQMEALRGLLELGYGQRITFRGEERQRTGTRAPSSESESPREAVRNIRPPVEPRIAGLPRVNDPIILPPDDPKVTVNHESSDPSTRQSANRTDDT